METSLLQTKLYAPSPSQRLVVRERLIQRLNEGLELGSKLTLVAAPVGYGKTTLVGNWLSTLNTPIAWLSLDAEDNDLSRFWTYVIAALQTVQPKLGYQIITHLQNTQTPHIENLLTDLINQATTLTHKIILILDDFHLVETTDIHKGLNFLIEHLPPQLHLVFITREDPPIPLAQMRVKGQICELRTKDLRFTRDESTQFLNQFMQLDLLLDEIIVLDRRTEGWIAGLQMAALSMQNLTDRSGFIDAFAGDDRYVMDYLIEEVIARQPKHIQEFLLQTSILKRLTASLCDAVTGKDDGRDNLYYLEQTNLFLISLDNRRLWYRYHQLFGDLLYFRLMDQVSPEGIKKLHRKAVDWYENNGLYTEAIDHALSGEYFNRAGSLIEQAAMTTIFEHTEWAKLLRWMELLPPQIVETQPQLSLTFAWALFTTGRWEKVEPFLQRVESAIIIGDETDERAVMLGEVITIRALVAYERGEMAHCLELAFRALEHIPEEVLFIRCIAILAKGMANLWLGDSGGSRSALHEAYKLSQSAGNTTVTIVALGYLVQLEVKLGCLNDAASYYDEALRLGTTKDGKLLGPMGLACVQMGEVLRERNELERASQILTQGVELSEQQTGMSEYVFEGLITLARVQIAGGDTTNLEKTIQRAESQLARLRQRSGDVEPIISLALEYRARLWLELGKAADTTHWLEEIDTKLGDGSVSGREVAFVLLARSLIQQERTEEAASLLLRLLETDIVCDTTRLAVESLVLGAIALDGIGKADQADELFIEALQRAEPEGYVRLFVGEGEFMASLLDRISAESEATIYAEKLLSELHVEENEKGVGDPRKQSRLQPLSEVLTDQERCILRLMSAGLSHREIAEELYLSVNTVKWHSTHIYSKLGVHRRAHAVSRAHELGIL